MALYRPVKGSSFKYFYFFVIEKHKRAQKGHLWRHGKDMPENWKPGGQEGEKITLHFSTVLFLPQTFATGGSETSHRAGGTSALTPWVWAWRLVPRVKDQGRRCARGWHGNSQWISNTRSQSGCWRRADESQVDYFPLESISQSPSDSKIPSEYFPIGISVQIHVTKPVVVRRIT